MTTEVYKATPNGWEEAKPQEPVGEVAEYYKSEVWGNGLTTGLGDVLAHLLGIPYEGTRIDDLRGYGIQEALKVLNRPKSMWWNPKRLLLGISDGENEVGVRLSQLRIPLMGLNWENVEELYQGLKSHLVSH
jgi:hypothetical protein